MGQDQGRRRNRGEKVHEVAAPAWDKVKDVAETVGDKVHDVAKDVKDKVVGDGDAVDPEELDRMAHYHTRNTAIE